jgi:hypothetical protein
MKKAEPPPTRGVDCNRSGNGCFHVDPCQHGLMKADWRISVKDF